MPSHDVTFDFSMAKTFQSVNEVDYAGEMAGILAGGEAVMLCLKGC